MSPLKTILFIVWVAILLVLVYFTWGVLAIDRVLRAFYVMLTLTLIWIVIGAVGFGWNRIRQKMHTN